MEPVQDGGYDGGRDLRRDRLLAGGARLNEPRDGLALHVFHDEEELAVRRDDVQGLDDVGVLDPGDEAGLVEEHRDEARVARMVRMEALDGDSPYEAAGAHHAPVVDGRHSSRG